MRRTTILAALALAAAAATVLRWRAAWQAHYEKLESNKWPT